MRQRAVHAAAVSPATGTCTLSQTHRAQSRASCVGPGLLVPVLMLLALRSLGAALLGGERPCTSWAARYSASSLAALRLLPETPDVLLEAEPAAALRAESSFSWRATACARPPLPRASSSWRLVLAWLM